MHRLINFFGNAAVNVAMHADVAHHISVGMIGRLKTGHSRFSCRANPPSNDYTLLGPGRN